MPSVWGGTLARVTRKDHSDEFDDDLEDEPRRKGRFDRGSEDVFHSDQLESVGADMAFGAVRGEGSRRRGPKARRNELLEEALRARLAPVGYDVRFRDDEVYVDGELIGHGLRRRFLKVGARDWLRDDRAFADLVHRFLLPLLRDQGKQHVKSFDRRLYLKRCEDQRQGYDVMRGQKAIAHFTATAFTTAAGEQQRGRFWAPGEHWDEALLLLLPKDERPKPQPPSAPRQTAALSPPPRQSVEEAVRGLLGTRPKAPPRDPDVEQFTNWPADAPADLRRQAEEASLLLRDHRVRADDFPVVIDCGAGRIVTFQPLKRHRRSGRLRLPFELAAPQGVLRGLIYLASPQTPLTISIQHHDTTLPLALAWALVFEVAAAKYCAPTSVAEDERDVEPGGFRPDGATRDVLTHWVRAHRYRLPEGRRAGDDAVKAAEEVDIVLPDGYGWRKGHWRGRNRAVEIDGALRFTWQPRRRTGSTWR